MASLTITAYWTRKFIIIGGAGLVILMVSWSLMTAAIAAYKAAHPPYVAPEMKYGKLADIVFPKKDFEKKSFSFELPNDALPSYKDQTKVYIIYRPVDTILALDADTKIAQSLGFMDKPSEIKPNIYQFTNNTTSQTLTMNVLDGSFKMEYPYQNDQLLLNPDKMPTKEEAINSAQNYLQTAEKLSEDLVEGEKKVSYWKINFDGLKSVPSQSEANVIRVDFLRKNLNDLKIVTSEPNRPPVSVLVSGSSIDTKKIIEVNYKYINIDRESFSTYPIKSSQQAAEELKKGIYWPAVDTSASSVSIKQMYLAYFEPVSLTNYLQPVYVFEGSNGFVAYVPAIADSATAGN